MEDVKIFKATTNDLTELYNLQLLSFESEAEMIQSRDVPALQESLEHLVMILLIG